MAKLTKILGKNNGNFCSSVYIDKDSRESSNVCTNQRRSQKKRVFVLSPSGQGINFDWEPKVSVKSAR